VTSSASVLITSADLTVTTSVHLKSFSILTLLRLQSTKKCERLCSFCFNGIC